MADILQEGFRKLMRYAQNLAEYNKAIEDGIIDENVFVIVLEEKVAKFKGHTFEWNENVRALLAVPREELTDEEAQYNIDTRNRIILGDTKLVVVLEGLTGIHYYNDVDNNVYVSYRVVSDGYVLSYEFIINEDGGVELSQEIFALTICDMRNRDDVMLFFAGVNIFSEVKGIINGEDGTQYEVDAYNLESRFVEYNKGDKRYRVMFDESYTIIEEIDITPTGSGGGGSNITVDSEMSSTSTNPVQNKVVYSELQKKQGTISDLADIRSGAALGKTALQSVPSEYVTESELTEKGYATTSQVNDKQDKIDDLEAIRSGAAKGETAIQKVKTINGESIEGEGNIVIKGGETDTSNLATKDELNNLNNEVIANEEVIAAALNDLNSRIVYLESIISTLNNN